MEIKNEKGVKTMNEKFCPMARKKCIKEKCAWYSKEFCECAVKSIGESIGTIMVHGEDDGIKVSVNYED